MDLLTHICSGAVAATVVAACFKRRPGMRLKTVAAGALGGALPDVDAIGMWSGFDATLGRLFGLAQSGRAIYGDKLWYSHHAFFHSLAAALLLALLLGATGYCIHRIRREKDRIGGYFKENLPVMLGFAAGYSAHLPGDLPTPASVWGGVRMFWPWAGYVGGGGQVWWWNNYDLFLAMLLAAAVNTLLLLLRDPRIRRQAVSAVAALAFALALVQIGMRRSDYAYTGNTPHYALMEQRSKEEQRRILGRRLYRGMEWIDDRLPVMF